MSLVVILTFAVRSLGTQLMVGMQDTIYMNHSCNKVASGCNLTVPGNFSGTPSVSLSLALYEIFRHLLPPYYSRTQAADPPTQTTQGVPSPIGAEHRTDHSSMR
jgi:hypothetical protein